MHEKTRTEDVLDGQEVASILVKYWETYLNVKDRSIMVNPCVVAMKAPTDGRTRELDCRIEINYVNLLGVSCRPFMKLYHVITTTTLGQAHE